MMRTRKAEPKQKSVRTAPARADGRRRAVTVIASAPLARTETIGVRQLRDSFSERLRRVRAGATITVTDHGEPVAMLIPFGLPAGILRMLSEGTLTWSGSKDYPPPLPLGELRSPPSDGWYSAMKDEDDRAQDAAIGASSADLRP